MGETVNVLDNFLERDAGNEYTEEHERQMTIGCKESSTIARVAKSNNNTDEGLTSRVERTDTESNNMNEPSKILELCDGEQRSFSGISDNLDQDSKIAKEKVCGNDSKILKESKESPVKEINILNGSSRLKSFINIDSKIDIDDKDTNDTDSTSSCSCEDHSSMDDEDQRVEVLDYGEDDDDCHDDSISKRGIQSSNQSRNSDADDKKNINQAEETCDKPKSRTAIDDRQPRRSKIKKSSKQRMEKNPSSSDVLPGRASSPDFATTYTNALNYIMKDACFFLMKSINTENIEISKSVGVWSTHPQNESKLNNAFNNHKSVILIFSVQQSGKFQGFARMLSQSSNDEAPVSWILPERLNLRSLGGIIKVEWLCTKELSFNDASHLYNAFNENKPIKIGRDGQMIEPTAGKKLCFIFSKDDQVKLISVAKKIRKMKEKTRANLSKHLEPESYNGISVKNHRHHHSDHKVVNSGFNHYNHNANRHYEDMYTQSFDGYRFEPRSYRMNFHPSYSQFHPIPYQGLSRDHMVGPYVHFHQNRWSDHELISHQSRRMHPYLRARTSHRDFNRRYNSRL